jgi:hypothetical protein
VGEPSLTAVLVARDSPKAPSARLELVARDDGLKAIAGRLMYPWAKKQQDQADREAMNDQALVIAAVGEAEVQHQMEMMRRPKDAVENLTAEIVTSRESSERLTGQLDASIGSLNREIVIFRMSSDQAARKLAWLTWVIIGLTVVVAGLTAALFYLTVQGSGPASPAPAPARATHPIITPNRAPAIVPASPSGKAARATDKARPARRRR